MDRSVIRLQTVEQRRRVLKDFDRLGWRKQRKIISLARRGQVYPDSEIAEIAYRWALLWLPDNQGSKANRITSDAAKISFDLALAGTVGGGNLLWLKFRRWARLIVKATEDSKRNDGSRTTSEEDAHGE